MRFFWLIPAAAAFAADLAPQNRANAFASLDLIGKLKSVQEGGGPVRGLGLS
jgi:hypothetical protein